MTTRKRALSGGETSPSKRQKEEFSGDGGLQMNIQELETVAFYKLPIKIFLINNDGYGIIKQTQDTWLDSRYVGADPENGLGIPNFVKIANAYGIEAIEMKNQKRNEIPNWTYYRVDILPPGLLDSYC